jgi:hypothetical protein
LRGVVDADTSLHAEVPLIALLSLVHVGVAHLLGTLGRGRWLMIVASTIVLAGLGLEMTVRLLEQAPPKSRMSIW